MDTDFTAKLIDVYPPNPDYPLGFDLNIGDSIVRMRYRDSLEKAELMKPGEVYQVTIHLYPTSNVFAKGHRIRVDVSSSNFPRFDVNPNTGEPLQQHRRMVPADNTVYHRRRPGVAHRAAGHTEEPVVPGRSRVERQRKRPVANTHIGLIRGINVGKAKRVAMADLRALVADLGYGDVRTLLNSGNLVFTTRAAPASAASHIEKAIGEKLGVTAHVIVLTADELAAAVTGNPLLKLMDNPSRLMVAVLGNPADRSKLEPLLNLKWDPEKLAIGGRVAYLWIPDGVLDSRLFESVGRALGDAVTTRNWATVMKLHAMANGKR